jgi:hypothetical protein
MSTFSQLLYQLVFGSKDYNSFISSENENVLYAYIADILKNKKCPFLNRGWITKSYSYNHSHSSNDCSCVSDKGYKDGQS